MSLSWSLKYTSVSVFEIKANNCKSVRLMQEPKTNDHVNVSLKQIIVSICPPPPPKKNMSMKSKTNDCQCKSLKQVTVNVLV